MLCAFLALRIHPAARRCVLSTSGPEHFDSPIILNFPVNEAIHAHRTYRHAFTRIREAGLGCAAVGRLKWSIGQRLYLPPREYLQYWSARPCRVIAPMSPVAVRRPSLAASRDNSVSGMRMLASRLRR